MLLIYTALILATVLFPPAGIILVALVLTRMLSGHQRRARAAQNADLMQIMRNGQAFK